MFLDDWTTCLCPFLQAQKLESIPIDLLHSNQCFALFCKLQKNTVCPLLSRAFKSHKLLNMADVVKMRLFFTIFKPCSLFLRHPKRIYNL